MDELINLLNSLENKSMSKELSQGEILLVIQLCATVKAYALFLENYLTNSYDKAVNDEEKFGSNKG